MRFKYNAKTSKKVSKKLCYIKGFVYKMTKKNNYDAHSITNSIQLNISILSGSG